MDLFNKDDLNALMIRREELCISIFMPTHRVGVETRQDPIRLNNLLSETKKQLLEYNLSSTDADKLLKQAKELLLNTLFWQHQDEGMAMFISSNYFRYYRLPSYFDKLVVVGDRFHIKPLIFHLSGWGRFYILALSQNEIRLLQGTQYKINRVDLENVPCNIAEALKYDDPEKQLQFRTGTPRVVGKRPAIFHDHGVGTDDPQHKANILRYFQKVDKGIYELLKKEKAPLVLAGVEYLLPIYQEANSYHNLVKNGITGNPEQLS
jgi:hypothetical protein